MKNHITFQQELVVVHLGASCGQNTLTSFGYYWYIMMHMLFILFSVKDIANGDLGGQKDTKIGGHMLII